MGRLAETEVIIYAILLIMYFVYMTGEAMLEEPFHDYRLLDHRLRVILYGFSVSAAFE